MPKAKVSRQTLRRLSSEDKLLDAFEAVICRNGIENVGVNAIIKEANVGKGLLYEYFGDLDGLAAAWVNRRHLVPAMEEVIGEPVKTFIKKPYGDQVASLHINYATMLKQNPVALNILAEDILTHGQLPTALQIIRRQIGITHEKFFTEVTPIHDDDDMALVFVLQAAANYLALRAQSSPNYNGVMLDTDEGWDQLMGMVRRVSKLAIKGKGSDKKPEDKKLKTEK